MNKFLVSLLGVAAISAALIMNIYESLDITKEEARECLLQSIGEGLLMRGSHSELVSKARQLPVEEKVDGVRQLILLAKEYSQTEAFKKDYKKWRNNKLNPGTKTRIGVPRLGKIIENKIDSEVDKSDNEKKYPSEPVDMIKKRLTAFLAISATVDFDAQLQGTMFANPEYEKKSAEWKMCYRAGKPVVEAAREEARKWLDELN